MSEAKSEVAVPWTDKEFCAELGRQWLKIYKSQTGKEHPWGPKEMWTSEDGLALVGKNYREKVKQSDKLNLVDDYNMLAFHAKSMLKQKYGLA